jgi:hypothetical protein
MRVEKKYKENAAKNHVYLFLQLQRIIIKDLSYCFHCQFHFRAKRDYRR